MTREAFRAWAEKAVRIFDRDGPVAKSARAFAVELEEHDAELARLYHAAADANEAIRAHLAKRAGDARSRTA